MENQTTNTEVSVAVNPELELIINNSGVEIAEAQAIAKNYLPFIERNNDLNVRMEKINFETPAIGDDKIAREIRLLKVKVRTDCDKVRKKDKAVFDIKSDFIQDMYNSVKKACEADEEKLESVEKFIENAEKKRINDLQIERVALLLPYNESANLMQLGAMPEAMWNDTLAGAKMVHQKKIDDARIAEEQRIESERLLKLKDERIKLLLNTGAKEIEGKIELIDKKSHYPNEIDIKELSTCDDKTFEIYLQEFQATEQSNIAYDLAIETENKRLKDEKAIKDKRDIERNSELKPYIVFIRDYSALLNSDEESYKTQFLDIKKGAELQWEYDRKQLAKKAKEDEAKEQELEKATKARLKAEKELKEKKDAEAKIAADKIKADEAALLEKRKQELAPDKQKLIAMIEGMIIIIPKLQSNESKDVSEQIDNKFEGFKNWSIEQINTLS